MNAQPVASVRVITYNQGPYVRQALDSALSQLTDFPYEVVVGDDGSTDDTISILCEYRARYGDRLRLLLAERHVGGRHNFMRTLRACRGRFIALLDGDDFWTSPVKLQRQVDALDSRPELAAVFHDVRVVDGAGRMIKPRFLDPAPPAQSGIAQLLAGNYLPTSATTYRAGLFGDFPPWFGDLPFADWALHVLNAQRGRLQYQDVVMAAYRVHDGGWWSRATPEERFVKTATVAQRLSAHLGGRYDRAILSGLGCAWLELNFPLGHHGKGWSWRVSQDALLASWPREFPLDLGRRRLLLAAVCVRLARARRIGGDLREARLWFARGVAQAPREAFRSASANFWLELAVGRGLAWRATRLSRAFRPKDRSAT